MRVQKPLRLAIMTLAIVLVGITWVAEVREILRAFATYSTAQDIMRVNAEVDALLQAGQNLAFERGRTNLLLVAPDTPSDKNKAFIEARREAAAKNLDRILTDPTLYANPLFDRVRSEYSALGLLRATVDSALARPLADRPKGLAARWFAETTALVRDVSELAASISLMNDRHSIPFRALSRLKILSFELRNALGTEAARIAAAAQSPSVTPVADMYRINQLRGEGNAIWESLRRESRITLNPVAEKAVATIAREYYGAFRPIQDEALAALDSRRSGGEGRIDVARLAAASVPALDSIAQALSSLSEESARLTERQHKDARDDLARAIAVAAIAFAAGIFSLLVIRGRLFAPLTEIGEALERLAAGDLSEGEARFRHRDELSRGYETVAAFRTSLLKRKELEERLTALSNSDGLTGIANRRMLDAVLSDEWNRAARTGTVLTVAMLDVDLFKSFNDRYGHLAGDECLKAIARLIEGRARRPGDLAARYGGEEFAAVLPLLANADAEAWANEVRESVLALAIPHELAPTGFVTVSAGIATARPLREGSPLDLIARADAALYKAKSDGRNRVVAAPGNERDDT